MREIDAFIYKLRVMCCQFEMSYHGDITWINKKKIQKKELCFSYVAIFKIPLASARMNNLIDMCGGSSLSYLNDFQSICLF